MRILKILTVYVFLFLIAGCSGSSPESVVLKYYKAIEIADFQTAKTCVAKADFAILDMLIEMTKEEQPAQYEETGKPLNILVKSVEIADDKNTAKVTIEETADNGLVVGETEVLLVKEEGEWKITL